LFLIPFLAWDKVIGVSSPNFGGHVPPYLINRTDMYTGRVVCCPLVSHVKYADGTDRQMDRRTDTRPLQYAFRYERGQYNKYDILNVTIYQSKMH